MRNITILATAVALLFLSACSTVPREVVELSYVMGQDIDALKVSYRDLVHRHYDALRAQRLAYLDKEWKPAFIKTWIADGHLIPLASGSEVFSQSAEGFVKPTPGKEEIQLLDGVAGWAEDAIEQITIKRGELINPLDQDEKELIAIVDESFGRLTRGNALITAHLNSLNKVQSVQDDFMKAIDLKGLRAAINDKLSDASIKADKALKSIKDADKKLANSLDGQSSNRPAK